MGCSLFEAQSLTELVQEVYFPWLAQTEALQAGQLLMTAVSADEPGHKPLERRMPQEAKARSNVRDRLPVLSYILSEVEGEVEG